MKRRSPAPSMVKPMLFILLIVLFLGVGLFVISRLRKDQTTRGPPPENCSDKCMDAWSECNNYGDPDCDDMQDNCMECCQNCTLSTQKECKNCCVSAAFNNSPTTNCTKQ